MMANVSGMRIRTMVPWPIVLWMSSEPPMVLDVGLDHVHADAAAGNGCYRRGGRETGQEDQPQQALRTHPRGLLRRDEALFDGAIADAFGVDAAAVIADLHIDLPPFVVGAETDAALRLLSRRQALRRRFNAVVDGVANQMRQRVADGFDQGLVQFGLAAFGFQMDFLAAGLRGVAHQAREAIPDIADRLQPRLHDGFLQFRGYQIELATGVQECWIILLLAVLQDLIARQNDFSGNRHQFIEQIDVDPNRGIVDRRTVRRGSGAGIEPRTRWNPS